MCPVYISIACFLQANNYVHLSIVSTFPCDDGLLNGSEDTDHGLACKLCAFRLSRYELKRKIDDYDSCILKLFMSQTTFFSFVCPVQYSLLLLPHCGLRSNTDVASVSNRIIIPLFCSRPNFLVELAQKQACYVRYTNCKVFLQVLFFLETYSSAFQTA